MWQLVSNLSYLFGPLQSALSSCDHVPASFLIECSGDSTPALLSSQQRWQTIHFQCSLSVLQWNYANTAPLTAISYMELCARLENAPSSPLPPLSFRARQARHTFTLGCDAQLNNLNCACICYLRWDLFIFSCFRVPLQFCCDETFLLLFDVHFRSAFRFRFLTILTLLVNVLRLRFSPYLACALASVLACSQIWDCFEYLEAFVVFPALHSA